MIFKFIRNFVSSGELGKVSAKFIRKISRTYNIASKMKQEEIRPRSKVNFISTKENLIEFDLKLRFCFFVCVKTKSFRKTTSFVVESSFKDSSMVAKNFISNLFCLILLVSRRKCFGSSFDNECVPEHVNGARSAIVKLTLFETWVEGGVQTIDALWRRHLVVYSARDRIHSFNMASSFEITKYAKKRNCYPHVIFIIPAFWLS